MLTLLMNPHINCSHPKETPFIFIKEIPLISKREITVFFIKQIPFISIKEIF